MATTNFITSDITDRILLIRKQKAILDADLAWLYGVSTKRLNEQVKRNKGRFPPDFVFQLNTEEKSEVVAKCAHLSKLKYSKSLPYAFTEHGTIMVASVLSSPRAVEVSIFVVRAFIYLREMLAGNKDLQNQLTELEKRLDTHDEAISSLVDAINHFIASPAGKHLPIGFHANI